MTQGAGKPKVVGSIFAEPLMPAQSRSVSESQHGVADLQLRAGRSADRSAAEIDGIVIETVGDQY
jgi:hypothetical protein